MTHPQSPIPLPILVTDWYGADVNPVWPGNYDVEVYRGGVESPDLERWMWTGTKWQDQHGLIVQLHPQDKWRGVLS